jgi:hypothetical protein
VIDGQEYTVGGSLTDDRVAETRAGGVAINREAHFTIPKTVLVQRPATGTLVTVEGLEMEITRVSGLDPYDPNWSIRAERWRNK